MYERHASARSFGLLIHINCYYYDSKKEPIQIRERELSMCKEIRLDLFDMKHKFKRLKHIMDFA